MLQTVLGLTRFGASLIFGLAISLLFSGISFTKEKRAHFVFLFAFFLFIQTSCYWLFGLGLTSKLYPLIIHLPLVFIFALYYKRPWLISIVSVLSGYLCCQAPRWIGFLAGAAFNSQLADHIFYIIAVFFAYHFFKHYVAGSVREVMAKSVKSCLLVGGVPLFYYAFDYVTTIYTDMLYRGAKWAVQFLPSIISVFYFVFVILYYAETQKQASLQHERSMLNAQFRQAQTEFSSLCQLQQNAAAYRHDMRHHFALLQSLAANGCLDEIRDYLHIAQADIDAITPIRFCENETVNLILSSFSTKAKHDNISLTVDARLPKALPFSDTELCSLLSNALENAIQASKEIIDIDRRIILLRLYAKNNKLCIDIRNRYNEAPFLNEGLPVSTQAGHGFGTKSMAHIVEKHGGVFHFSLQDGWFLFQATA